MCTCSKIQEPVSLATLDATLGKLITALAAGVSVLEGRILPPVVAMGSGAHTAYVGSSDVYTKVEVDTEIRVEVSPANNSDGSTKATSLAIYVGPDASVDGAVSAAEHVVSIPNGGVGSNYPVAVSARVPAGYYFRVEASTTVSGGLDTTATRVVRSGVKA